MKRYLNLKHPSEGRALAYDDFEALEELALFPQTMLFGMGDCVVDGCSFDSGQGLLNAGVVWLGSKLYDFPGGKLHDSVRNVDNKYIIVQPTFEHDDPRPNVSGGTVEGMRREIAVLSDTIPAGKPWVKVDNPLTTIRLTNRWQERLRAPGTVEWLANVGSEYDSTGRGQGNALGWALCNGANNTIDLRGRFVLGHNPSSNVNSTFLATSVHDYGGDEKVLLTEQQMPRHTHSIDYAGNHRHEFTSHGDREGGDGGGREPYNYGDRPNAKTIYTNEVPSHYHTMQPTGGTDAHPNMPPYYVLAARQWVGLYL